MTGEGTVNDEELVEVIEKAGDRERLFAFSDEQITALKAIGLAMVPVKEEHIVRGVLDDLRSAGFQVFKPEDRSTWKFCPVCGRHNRPTDGGMSGVVYCSPTNCEAWRVTATFDHATREWVPADSGGSG